MLDCELFVSWIQHQEIRFFLQTFKVTGGLSAALLGATSRPFGLNPGISYLRI
jgi:hypothetical protein